MNILYLGDIMGEPGIHIVQKLLPSIITKHKVDVVIAQSENVTDGRGMSPKDMKRLQLAGVDVFTGGNHSVQRKSLQAYLLDPQQPVVAPANMTDNLGKQYYQFEGTKGPVLVISLLGEITPKQPTVRANSFQTIDQLLDSIPNQPNTIIVNIHAEYSSEKLVMGQYLDGRVSAVVGDHWHVPTADATILPGGTAHITDVGMCGTVNSSLGVKTQNIISRLRDGKFTPNTLETQGSLQLCSVLIETNQKTGRSKKITQLLPKLLA